MEILGKTPIHPLPFITGKLCGYLTWLLLVLDINDIIQISGDLPNMIHVIALASIIAGVLFIIASSIFLGRNIRMGLAKSDTNLKTTGIYKISRNPMYMGLHMITLGAIIYTFNLFVLIMGIYSVVVYHFIITSEEKFLEERFGKNYINYKENVKRYF